MKMTLKLTIASVAVAMSGAVFAAATDNSNASGTAAAPAAAAERADGQQHQLGPGTAGGANRLPGQLVT